VSNRHFRRFSARAPKVLTALENGCRVAPKAGPSRDPVQPPHYDSFRRASMSSGRVYGYRRAASAKLRIIINCSRSTSEESCAASLPRSLISSVQWAHSCRQSLIGDESSWLGDEAVLGSICDDPPRPSHPVRCRFHPFGRRRVFLFCSCYLLLQMLWVEPGGDHRPPPPRQSPSKPRPASGAFASMSAQGVASRSPRTSASNRSNNIDTGKPN
jgi:hypothetical protein